MTHINNQITQGLKSKPLGFMRTKEILLLATINQLTMRNLLIFIFSLFFFSNSFAQKNKAGDAKIIDSLKQLYKKKEPLSLNGYKMLALHYNNVFNPDSLDIVLQDYKKEAENQKSELHLSKVLANRALYFAKQNKIDSALYYFKKQYYHKGSEIKDKQRALNNIAICFRFLKQPDSSIVYVKKGLNLAKKLKYDLGVLDGYIELSNITTNKKIGVQYADSALQFIRLKPNLYNIQSKVIAVLYKLGEFSKENRDYLKAKNFFKQTLDSCYKYKENYIQIHTNNEISHCYVKLNQPDSARYYLTRNLNNPLFEKNLNVKVRTYQKLGNLEELQKDYPKALKYFDKSISIAKRNSEQYNITQYYKAELLVKLKRYREARNTLSEIRYKLISDKLDLIKEYHYLKYQIFTNLKQQDSTLYHIDKFVMISDSIHNNGKTKAVSELQTKYQTQQKENEILKLSNDNIKKEAEAKTKSTQLTYSLFGGGAILLLSLFTLRAYRKEKKSKEQIELQKKEIETLHKEVHHRVKNNLAVAKSFTSIAKENVHDKKGQEALNALQSRIDSMANVHEILYKQDNISAVNFQSYTERICEEISKAFDGKKRNINYSVEANVQIPINEAIPLGLILNEAVTNSFKYAFKEKGNISIQISEQKNEIKCTISDDGVGIPKDFNIEELNSYGMELIQTLVMQLEGSLEIKNQNGTQINITIPKN